MPARASSSSAIGINDPHSAKEQRADDIVAYARLAACAAIGIGTAFRMRQVVDARGIPDGLFGILPSGSMLATVGQATSSLAPLPGPVPLPSAGPLGDLLKWIWGTPEDSDGGGTKTGMVKIKQVNMPLLGMAVPAEFKTARGIEKDLWRWTATFEKNEIIQTNGKGGYEDRTQAVQDLDAFLDWLRTNGFSIRGSGTVAEKTKFVTGYDVDPDFAKDLIAISYGAMAGFVALMATDKEVISKIVPVAKSMGRGVRSAAETGAKVIDAVLPDSIV